MKHKLTTYHIVLLLLGIVYSVKAIPVFSRNRKIIFKRLKDLPFAKSVTVSILLGTAFFAISMSVYPETEVNKFEVISIMISFTLGIFMNTNFADLRDLKGDKAVGVPTIPVLFGKKGTYIGAMLVPGILWFAIISIFFVQNLISVQLFALFILNLLFPLFYISLYNLKKSFRRFVTPISDSCVLIYAVGLVFLANV